MSRITKITWLGMVLLFLGLAACGGGAPTPDPALAFTQIWQTVEVAQAQTALAASPTPRMTDTPAVSPTPQSTNTPLLTNTPLCWYSIIYTMVPSRWAHSRRCVTTPVGVADVTYPGWFRSSCRGIIH